MKSSSSFFGYDLSEQSFLTFIIGSKYKQTKVELLRLSFYLIACHIYN